MGFMRRTQSAPAKLHELPYSTKKKIVPIAKVVKEIPFLLEEEVTRSMTSDLFPVFTTVKDMFLNREKLQDIWFVLMIRLISTILTHEFVVTTTHTFYAAIHHVKDIHVF